MADEKVISTLSRGDTLEKSRPAAWDYRFIMERILKIQGKYKSVLFGSSQLKSMPVTIPVNCAIEIVKNKKRCLLIDMDLERDAIAKAFDISYNPSAGRLRPKVRSTGFDGLLVWPGHNFTAAGQMNIRGLVEAAVEKFDMVLVNAPCLGKRTDRMQVAGAVKCGLIFSEGVEEATELAAIMKRANCKIIGNIQSRPTCLEK